MENKAKRNEGEEKMGCKTVSKNSAHKYVLTVNSYHMQNRNEWATIQHKWFRSLLLLNYNKITIFFIETYTHKRFSANIEDDY